MSIHLFPILFPFDSVWLCFSFTRFDVPTLIYRYLEKKKKKASTSLVNLPKKLLCCFIISNHHKMLPFYYKNQKWYIRFPFLSVHSNQYAFKCQHLNQLFISFSSYIFKAYVRGARPPPPSRIIKTIKLLSTVYDGTSCTSTMNFEWDHDKVTEYFVCIYLSVDIRDFYLFKE